MRCSEQKDKMNNNKHKEQLENEHRQPQRELGVTIIESGSKVSNVNAERAVATNTTDSFSSSDSSASDGTFSASNVVSPDEKPQMARGGNKVRSNKGRMKEGVVIGSPEWYAEMNRRIALLNQNIAHLQEEHKELFRENEEQNKRIEELEARMEERAQDPFFQYIKKVNAFNENRQLILSKQRLFT